MVYAENKSMLSYLIWMNGWMGGRADGLIDSKFKNKLINRVMDKRSYSLIL